MTAQRIINLNIGDWTTGTDGLSIEQYALYTKLTVALYAAGGTLPDDDASNAHRSKFDMRMFRRVKAELIAAGKLQAADGVLFNERVLEEVSAFDEAARRRSANGKLGPEARKKLAAAQAKAGKDKAQVRRPSRVTKPQLAASYDVANPQLGPSYALATTENAAISTSPQCPSYLNQNQNQKEDPLTPLAAPAPSEPAASAASGEGESHSEDKPGHRQVAKPSSAPTVRNGDYWKTALNSANNPLTCGVWWTPELTLAVSDAIHAELETKLAGNGTVENLLDIAGGQIETHWSGVDLLRKLRSVAARIAGQRQQQQKNYQATVAANAAKGGSKAQPSYLDTVYAQYNIGVAAE
jgi:uncharacterized protein YdaU (DUF1376 family)